MFPSYQPASFLYEDNIYGTIGTKRKRNYCNILIILWYFNHLGVEI